jgi:hypothetical protein
VSGLDLRPSFAAAASALGVPAVVTRPYPDDTPIETTGIWIPAIPTDVPFGMELQRQEPKAQMALPLADVPTLPSGSKVTAVDILGGTEKQWITDGEVIRHADEVRVYLIPDPDEGLDA